MESKISSVLDVKISFKSNLETDSSFSIYGSSSLKNYVP